MGLISFILSVNAQATSSSTLPNISFIEEIESISVAYNTAFGDVPLVTQATALLDNGESRLVDLEWIEGSYDETTVNTYTLFANIVQQPDISNLDGVQATMNVTVLIQENSLFFTGASSQLVNFGTTGDVQFLHTDPLAISFWFKWPSNPVTTNDVIFGTIDTGSQGRGFEFQMKTTGHISVELRNTNGTNAYLIETTGDFADDAWHHLIFSKGTTVASSNLWIDGVDVAITTTLNSLTATISTTDDIVLGARITGTNYIDGYIDKICIWDTDQTANVSDIFDTYFPLSLDEPPIHLWEFDGGSYEDTGTSASPLTGTPTNSPTFSPDVPVNSGDESFQYRIEEGDQANISEEAGYFVWGANVIEHAGTYYCIGNKWIDTDGFSGWVHYNRIYVGSSANKLGPFSLVTELSELRGQAWAADMVTNPNIIKIDTTYYLYYVGTTYNTVSYPVLSSEARNNQQIGVASASSPAGPWTPSANNPILSPSVSDWDQNIVNNPSVYVDGSDDINMVYKSDLNGTPNDLRLGKVKLTTWEGPVTDRATASPNFGLDVEAEDPTIWFEDGRYWAIFKAMNSDVVPVGHGILAVSDDAGATFRLAMGEEAYDLTIHWNDATSDNYSKIERPFVLVEAGVATALFTAVLRTDNTSFNVGIDLSARI